MVDLHSVRFYGILDTGYVSPDAWEAKCLALIEGGAGVIQMRAKKENHAQRRGLLERILTLFVGLDIPLIVNDDLELATSYPGLGLHIGQDDVSPEAARERLGTDRVLGLSTHSLSQAMNAIRKAELLDYFAVGPIFATGTKPDYIPVGTSLVTKVRFLEPPLPFFCIGGINRDNAGEVRAAGAFGVVAVSDVLMDPGTANATRAFLA